MLVFHKIEYLKRGIRLTKANCMNLPLLLINLISKNRQPSDRYIHFHIYRAPLCLQIYKMKINL